jgi:hypothetical protein
MLVGEKEVVDTRKEVMEGVVVVMMFDTHLVVVVGILDTVFDLVVKLHVLVDCYMLDIVVDLVVLAHLLQEEDNYHTVLVEIEIVGVVDNTHSLGEKRDVVEEDGEDKKEEQKLHLAVVGHMTENLDAFTRDFFTVQKKKMKKIHHVL